MRTRAGVRGCDVSASRRAELGMCLSMLIKSANLDISVIALAGDPLPSRAT